MDYILIEDLRLTCIIGVDDSERRGRQPVILDLALGHDAAPAGRSDDIAQALDYRAVRNRITGLVRASRYRLIEALAEAIAGVCLDDPRVREVQVTVRKPRALGKSANAGVRITRTRGGDSAGREASSDGP